jgi:glycosyltransferase involved in cell wall biosynthesis
MTRVAVVDPAGQVPYYDRGLSAALAASGLQVTLAESPLHHYGAGDPPPGVEMRQAFGTLRRGRAGRILWSSRTARRMMRAAGYGPELAAFVVWARRRRIDIVHLQWAPLPRADGWLLGRLRRLGLGTVLTVHNVTPHEPGHLQSAAALWRLYRAPDRLVVHSHASKRRLLARFPAIAGAAVDVIPMAADCPGRLVDRRQARAELSLPDRRPLVLFFGQPRPYKGLELLLAAFDRLAGQLPAAMLLVAGPLGEGVADAAGLRARLAAGISAGAICVLDGYVPHERVASCFGAADVVALPYARTDDSAILATARACGRAAVVTDVGGLAEAAAAGGALVVPAADPEALARALSVVLSDPAQRDTLEAEARQAARAWTWQEVALRHVVLYDAILREGC